MNLDLAKLIVESDEAGQLLLYFYRNQVAVGFSSRSVIDGYRAALPIAGEIVRTDERQRFVILRS